jgi:hypothetical protein
MPPIPFPPETIPLNLRLYLIRGHGDAPLPILTPSPIKYITIIIF